MGRMVDIWEPLPRRRWIDFLHGRNYDEAIARQNLEKSYGNAFANLYSNVFFAFIWLEVEDRDLATEWLYHTLHKNTMHVYEKNITYKDMVTIAGGDVEDLPEKATFKRGKYPKRDEDMKITISYVEKLAGMWETIANKAFQAKGDKHRFGSYEDNAWIFPNHEDMRSILVDMSDKLGAKAMFEAYLDGVPLEDLLA